MAIVGHSAPCSQVAAKAVDQASPPSKPQRSCAGARPAGEAEKSRPCVRSSLTPPAGARVAHPERRRNDDLVPAVHCDQERVVKDLLAAGGDNRVRGLVVEAVLAREPGCDWTARSAFCGLPSSAVRSCMGPRPTRIPRSGRRSQSVSASSRAIAATSSRFSGIADMFGPTKQLLDTEIIGPLLGKRLLAKIVVRLTCQFS